MALNWGQNFLGDISRISGVSICSLKKQKYNSFPWVQLPSPTPTSRWYFGQSGQAMKYLMLIKVGDIGIKRSWEIQDVYFLMFCNIPNAFLFY